mmetsp:Transcript_22839/g.69902  ORF Transcript_22839/g.69902 Transcript_22839/m.69902 type:complete len:216 (-) Transcript_22839:384-1031(-)
MSCRVLTLRRTPSPTKPRPPLRQSRSSRVSRGKLKLLPRRLPSERRTSRPRGSPPPRWGVFAPPPRSMSLMPAPRPSLATSLRLLIRRCRRPRRRSTRSSPLSPGARSSSRWRLPRTRRQSSRRLSHTVRPARLKPSRTLQSSRPMSPPSRRTWSLEPPHAGPPLPWASRRTPGAMRHGWSVPPLSRSRLLPWLPHSAHGARHGRLRECRACPRE